METVTVRGIVGGGNALGRKLGYPTANIYGVERLGAKDGVYAVTARVEGKPELYGMANLGYRPTVAAARDRRVLEVHFFDFRGDLYGREIEVTLCRYMRPERAFSDTAVLERQIREDERHVRDFFTEKP